jgi:antitoxin ParD1/3/4/toxin ParE1/3/4
LADIAPGERVTRLPENSAASSPRRTLQAQEDFRDIRDYVLREGGFRAARYVIGALVTSYRALARSPGQGHRRQDLTEREELRFWSVFSYLVVYRTDKKPLAIMALIHGKRNVQRILKERSHAFLPTKIKQTKPLTTSPETRP